MNKSDLTPGFHVVENRNGEKFLWTFVGGIGEKKGSIHAENYNEDLTSSIYEDSENDIVKVYEISENSTGDLSYIFKNAITIWRRENIVASKEHAQTLKELAEAQEKIRKMEELLNE